MNSITLPLPNGNSENSDLFRNVVGSASSIGSKVPGCYLLHSQDPTKDSYVGKSKSLAQRVREHANGHSNVQNLIKDFFLFLFLFLFWRQRNCNSIYYSTKSTRK